MPQARIMGTWAAQCMVGDLDELSGGFAFELFTHVTRFCGRKVVLLGRYNGQGLEHEPADDMVTYSRAQEVGTVLAFGCDRVWAGRMSWCCTKDVDERSYGD